MIDWERDLDHLEETLKYGAGGYLNNQINKNINLAIILSENESY